MLRQLRQPRYLGLIAFMVLIAAVCALAGTWQIQRLVEKHSANVLLRGNAETAVAPVAQVLATVTAAQTSREVSQTSPEASQINRQASNLARPVKFRPVSATGTYDAQAQLLVREQTVDDTVGYLVLTPLRTVAGADLLVVRGFLAANRTTAPQVASPPGQTVNIVGRVEPGQPQDDQGSTSPAGQIRAIDLAQAAGRLDRPVYAGYVELLPGQPGTEGLTVIPAPDLSNAAGGAIEPQHVAYIIQWYLFALVALSAPVMMARADNRRARAADPDADSDDPWAAFDSTRPGRLAVAETTSQAAKLTARYGPSRRV